ncbi:diguanylate cyclase (GGDEF) domain-containing protein [Geodermatophilus pulveris]|uniref:Diguanylate cyclase (GGDEF) domain-containing protein n=1 Tax=Geodermatophilus pulveris TaxID=1564159 RepID=A0A239IYN6_9ACTN|nr:GGDEF domain-containing protein [Geodermatophilus pulveris]SNS98645.1 diguanylate cyclase (GGDEF) domain-containing protein [Geodermatophilus pulveris]
MTPGPEDLTDGDLEDALWRLLAAADRDDPAAFTAEHDRAEAALLAATDPWWVAWRHALAARRGLVDGDRAAAAAGVAAAREALRDCPPDARAALALAHLAAVEVSADHVDAAMVLAVDACLLAEAADDDGPSRARTHAHLWLSLALAALDLEELAVAEAQAGSRAAHRLPGVCDRHRLLQLCAQQHAELAQTLHRRGETDRAQEAASTAVGCAEAARALDGDPGPDDQDLLDVVQAWAVAGRGDVEDAVGPLRRAHRRVHRDGGTWLRGYADLVLARVLTRLARTASGGGHDAEATDLLVDAAGAFAASGDRRRYRQCLLELGQGTAALGRPAEALHWLEAYRADTGRAQARGRELWAEMFVRRSRLRDARRRTAHLRRAALEDPLTGLGNRRSAESRLGALRGGAGPVSLAVVDVDRFKAVNDDTSHSHGDAVLRRVAELLREHSRTGDEVYRWAGDEFLVVLPTATATQALLAVDRLRAAVADADWGELQLPEPVTVSIGVATGDAGDGEPLGWRSLFDTADLHLSSAKRGGRNRVRAPGPTGAGETRP